MPSDTTNLSTSTRPKTPNPGGKLSDLVFSRKRRQVEDNSHALNFTNEISDFSNSLSTSSIDIVHASTIKKSHVPSSIHHTQSENIQYYNKVSTPAGVDPRPSDILSSTSKDGSFTYDFMSSKSSIKNSEAKLNIDNISEHQDIPLIFTHEHSEESDTFQTYSSEEQIDNADSEEDSSLFRLDSETYDEINNEHEFIVSELHDLNSSEVQQDAPLFPFIRDGDIQFFNVGSEHLSPIQKAKTRYNTDELHTEKKSSNLSTSSSNKNETLEEVVPKNPSLLKQPINTTKYHPVTDTSSILPKTEYVEIPATSNFSMPSTNKLILNITVATGFENNPLNYSQPIYVLSMLIPTDGVKAGVISNTKDNTYIKPNQMPITPVNTAPRIHDPDIDNSGGTCECSCPCLDSLNESTESESTEVYDIVQYSNVSTENSNTKLTYTKNPVTSSFSRTTLDMSNDENLSTTLSSDISESGTFSMNCSRNFKQLPPPPILILEGRIPNRQKLIKRSMQMSTAY